MCFILCAIAISFAHRSAPVPMGFTPNEDETPRGKHRALKPRLNSQRSRCLRALAQSAARSSDANFLRMRLGVPSTRLFESPAEVSGRKTNALGQRSE